MKKKKKRVGLLSYLLVFTMIITSFAGFVLPVRAEGTDVKDLFDVKVSEFRVVDNKANEVVILSDAMLDINASSQYFIRYDFTKESTDSTIKVGDHFEISLPAGLEHTSNGEIKIGDTTYGKYDIKDGKITITFTTDFNPQSGFVEFWGSLSNISGSQTITVLFSESSSATVTLNMTSNPGSGTGGGSQAGDPGAFQENQNKSVFIKKAHNKNGDDEIHYEFMINFSELQKIFSKRERIQKKQNVYLIDELPKVSAYDEYDMEFLDATVRVPIFAPEKREDGNVTTNLSENESFDNYKFLAHDKKELPVIWEENGNWHDFKNRIINEKTPVIGVWKRSKVIVYFGDLPNTLTYGSLVGGDDKLVQEIDGLKTVNNASQITEKQAEMMKAAYANNSPIVALRFDMFVKAKYFENGKWTYTNTATLHWDGTQSTEASAAQEAKGSRAGINLKTTLEVSKIWDLSNNQSASIPEKISFTLYKQIGVNGEKTAVETATLTASGWKKQYPKVSLWDDTSKTDIIYSVEEKAVDGFDTISYTSEYDANNNLLKLGITNKAKPENPLSQKKIHLTLKKLWDDNIPETKRPSELTFELYREVNGTKTKIQDYKVNSDKQWKVRISDLPKKDENNNLITYFVVEKEAVSYDVTYSEMKSTGMENEYELEVTNKAKTEDKTINLTLEKKWDNSIPVGEIPSKLTFELYKKFGEKSRKIGEYEVKALDNWTYKLKGLPEKEGDERITYYVVEKEAADYKATVSQMTGSGEEYKISVTNAKKEGPEKNQKLNFVVKKVWKNVDSSKAPEVTVGLYREGERIQTAVLSSSNKWESKFENLPAKDKVSGKNLNYEVKEESKFEGYTVEQGISIPTSTENDKEIIKTQSVTFTNTRKTDKINIAIKKNWVGLGGQAAPDATFTLLKNGSSTGKTLKLTKDNLIGIFKDLDQYDEEGKEIHYIVKEKKVEGFNERHTVTGNKTIKTKDGTEIPVTYYEFTNTNEKLKSIELNVEKQWVEGSEESVTFVLSKNGQDTDKSITLNAANNWKGSFGLLPRTENGALIDYDIKELTMSGYKVSYTRSTGEKTVNNEVVEYKNIVVTNAKVPSEGTPNIIIPIDPLPFTPPAEPDVPTFIPPEIPKEVEEFLLDDEDVVRASAEEEEPDVAETEPVEEEPNTNEDEEITDELPRANKEVPKTGDLFNGFANPLAVGTILSMGYGLKKLLKDKRKKKD